MLRAASLAALVAGACALHLPPCRPSAQQLAHRVRAPLPIAAMSDEEHDHDELDAEDTVSSWDEEVAQMRAWEAEQRGGAAAAPSPPRSVDKDAPAVDEEAHFGLFDDEAESDDARILRQFAEKEAALLLEREMASGKRPASAASDGSSKYVLSSLEAVLNALNRLTEKVDALGEKVDRMSASLAKAPAAPSSPAEGAAPAGASQTDGSDAKPEKAGGWDGEVDETAWFDDDDIDEDMPDWRDVRRLNKLL